MQLQDVWTLQTRGFAEGQRTFYADFQDKYKYRKMHILIVDVWQENPAQYSNICSETSLVKIVIAIQPSSLQVFLILRCKKKMYI